MVCELRYKNPEVLSEWVSLPDGSHLEDLDDLFICKVGDDNYLVYSPTVVATPREPATHFKYSHRGTQDIPSYVFMEVELPPVIPLNRF